jgi:hypothetical protein
MVLIIRSFKGKMGSGLPLETQTVAVGVPEIELLHPIRRNFRGLHIDAFGKQEIVGASTSGHPKSTQVSE